MRHKLAEISPEELEAAGDNTPPYCFKIRFFDPDGITLIGDPDKGLTDFPDIQTVQTFKVDINHEPEVLSPSVKTRFKEEVVFGIDYTPDIREEQITLYKHKKRDKHFADYEWYTSTVYIKPKSAPAHHRTTIFLNPQQNYISSITHEIEPVTQNSTHSRRDIHNDITSSKNDVTTSHWDAKFTLDEDQLEMHLKELDNFRNKLKQENIPTIYEGIGLDKNHPHWNGNTISHVNNTLENNKKLTINTCTHLKSFTDDICNEDDVTHRTIDVNSSFEDLPSPDYVDIEGVDGCSFEELDV